MALAEKIVQEHIDTTPERYAARVRWQAVIYLALNIISIVLIVMIAWRVQFFITLTQRSNVETLILAVIVVLAFYYLVTSFKGFIGALRMLWLNSPAVFDSSRKSKERVEYRKHTALKTGGESQYVCLDRAIRLRGQPGRQITWELGDEAGKLGELVIDGVKATYYPLKDGMSNSLFEFLANQIDEAIKKQDLDAEMQIVQWSSIDADQASAYHSMVQAFTNLEEQLGNKRPLWPAWEITQEDVDRVGEALNRLVPTLRNESLLPKLDYEVEYTIPVIPEPLAFMQLSRRDSRADPVITMGCAGIVMLGIMLLLTLFIFLPPWLPAR
ncbi:MAG: hypothetical protein ACJ78Q_13310 [Chloroflexia bacterium]